MNQINPAPPLAPPRPTDRRLHELGLTPKWMDRHPTFESLSQHYAKRYWSDIIQLPLRAYTAVCPLLGQLDELYGTGRGEEWVSLQLIELLVTSNAQPTTQIYESIRTFVASFAVTARAFRLTELMLFFARYKGGLYDNSFVAFDVRRIGHAFFHEYLPQRRSELGLVEEQRAAERARRERASRSSHAVSYNRFHQSPETTRYGLRLRFLHALTSPVVQDLCTLCHLDFPPLTEETDAVLTKAEMEQLAPHVLGREVAVDDSWELPSECGSSPAPSTETAQSDLAACAAPLS